MCRNQQDRRMETVPRAQRERRRRRELREPDRRQKTRGESKEKQEERDDAFLEPGCDSRASALLVKRAYLAAECVLAENEGNSNSYCLVSGGR